MTVISMTTIITWGIDMKMYTYSEINGSGTLVFTSENNGIADEYLKAVLKNPKEWELIEVD